MGRFISLADRGHLLPQQNAAGGPAPPSAPLGSQVLLLHPRARVLVVRARHREPRGHGRHGGHPEAAAHGTARPTVDDLAVSTGTAAAAGAGEPREEGRKEGPPGRAHVRVGKGPASSEPQSPTLGQAEAIVGGTS